MKINKFRVWDKIHQMYHYDFKIGANLFLKGENYLPLNEIFVISRQTQFYIFEQFIGIKDDKGNEVYEGDILQVLVGLGDTDDDKFYERIVIKPTKSFYESRPWGDFEDFEVIGNIHENMGSKKKRLRN